MVARLVTFYFRCGRLLPIALLSLWLKCATSGSWPVIESSRCCSVLLALPCALARRRISLLQGLGIARTVAFNERITAGTFGRRDEVGVGFAGAGAGPADIHALPFAARHDFGAGA